MDALKIEKATVAGFDWGARTADIVAALWPERCKAMVSVSGYLIGSPEADQAPLPPAAEFEWWYQFYFATDRGRAATARTHTTLRSSSGGWRRQSGTSMMPSSIEARPRSTIRTMSRCVHNYRWRLDLADGERKYDDLEKKLAEGPVIAVPTITMEGDANGAPHPEPAAYRNKFSGRYEHRLIKGGVGHNLPQEAPQAFAEAVISAAKA